jgi:hypothetical protein
MQKLIRGTIASLVILGLTACVDDPFAAINGDYKTVSVNPQIMYISKPGDSTAVLVRLVNDANNGGVSSYTVSGVGAGIAVHYDATYRPEYLNGSDTLVVPEDKNQQRYFVVGVTPGEWSFTLTATANSSASTTVKVRVEYTNLGAALSTTTAAIGDEVTVTAPPFSHFADDADVTFPTGPHSIITTRDPAGQFIKFVVGPNIDGPVTVTKVIQDYYPSVGALSLSSTNSLTTPAFPTVPTVINSTTPAFGDALTVTVPNDFQILSNSSFKIGSSSNAWVLSISADKHTAVIVPWGNSTTGTLSYTNLGLSAVPGMLISLPSNKSVTVAAPVVDPNLNSRATAPTIAFPASGATTVVSGNASWNNPGNCVGGTGDGCAIYKFVLGGTTTYDLTLQWDGGQDMGLYRSNSTGGASSSQGCDNGGQGSSGKPESCTVSNLAAGTYYFYVVFYGTGSGYPSSDNTAKPLWYQFSVTAH